MESVKITSGRYRSSKLLTPGGATHPMGSREKLALFNMLADYLMGARVLDAYAGSGALGIEALSRGATEVVFVEQNRRAVTTIHQNLTILSLKAQVLLGNVVKFTTYKKFDVIIADPPYDKFKVAEIEHLTQFLRPGGILALSHPNDPPEFPGLTLLSTHRYARAHISIYTAA